ncbi:MAG: hypothetical protein ACI4NM_03480 [Bullifex sp.]
MYGIIITALMCLLVSCSGAEYPVKLTESVAFESAVSADPAWAAEPGYDSCVISFDPVPGATSYTLNVGEILTDVIPSRDFSSGRIVRKVSGLESDTEYTVSLTAKSGGTVKNVDKTFSFRTRDIKEFPPVSDPVAYVGKRGIDYATVSFVLEKDMYYRAWWVDRNQTPVYVREESGQASSSGTRTITISGLEPDSVYEIHIQHAYREGEWGDAAALVIIPEYSGMEATLDFTLKEEGSYSVTGEIPSGSSLYLADADLQYFIKADGNGNLPFDELPSLTRMEFYAVAQDGSSVTAYSNRQTILTPVKPEVNSIQNEIVLTWPAVDGASYTVSALPVKREGRSYPDFIISDVTDSNGSSSVSLSGLVSRTTYDISVSAKLKDGSVSVWNDTVTTPSYEGTYRYTAGDYGIRSVFEVSVTARDEGLYPYEIKVSSGDSAYDGNTHVIAPLVEEPVSSFISFSNTSKPYMKAYVWNNKKWNTTSMTPSSWKPKSETVTGDRIVSEVLSKAMFMELTTETVFEFTVRDGNPVLIFSNKGIGKNSDFVNLGLFKNPLDPVNPYVYVLERR